MEQLGGKHTVERASTGNDWKGGRERDRKRVEVGEERRSCTGTSGQRGFDSSGP